jgi:SAM-dependent methyltransferase
VSEQLAHICLSNLERMLGDASWDAPAIAGRTAFQGRVETIRARLAVLDQSLTSGTPPAGTTGAGSAFLSLSLPALFEAAAEAEGYPQVPCAAEQAAVRELFRDWRDCYMSYLFLATRYFARKHFALIDVAPPSLEIGTDDGVTTRLTFSTKLTVGSNPSLPEFLRAVKLGTHRHYVCLDGTCIPFAGGLFRSVVLIYTFYHLTDRRKVLDEACRVLAPGGLLAFIDTARDVESWMPLTGMLDLLGFHQLAREFSAHWFSRYDSNRRYIEPTAYGAFLGEAGFELVSLTPFMSRRLTRVAYFTYLFDNVFGTESFLRTGLPEVEASYLRVAEKVLCPMLARDEAWCAEEGASAFRLVVARKKGAGGKAVREADVLDHLRCPRDGSRLVRKGNVYRSVAQGVEYPVINDVPLLIPFYADWYRQRARPARSA